MPEGCALTGIALRERSDKLKNMKLYYQVVNRGESNNNEWALESKINEMYVGDERDEYEVEYKPSTNNGRVLQGIGVKYSDKNNKIVTLNLLMADFYLPLEHDAT